MPDTVYVLSAFLIAVLAALAGLFFMRRPRKPQNGVFIDFDRYKVREEAERQTRHC